MIGNKDTMEVANFLGLIAKLKHWSDDDPNSLPDLAKGDDGVKALCDQVFWSAYSLRIQERRHPQLFASPVDPKYLAAWRDFEERFESVLKSIWLADLFPDLDAVEPKSSPEADLRWENAERSALEEARVIEGAIDYANSHADGGIIEGSHREFIERGISAWERLKSEAGFDLRGVFRRRELVPFVLIPRHVAAKHGSAEALSMLKNLQQAHEAFVFGAPFASLALMRSILEALLRDHYGAEGRDLSERINHARKILPRGASVAALHRLRKRANAILHLDSDKDEGLPEIEPVQMEREIVSLLFVLRALIEGVPQRRAR